MTDKNAKKLALVQMQIDALEKVAAGFPGYKGHLGAALLKLKGERHRLMETFVPMRATVAMPAVEG